MVAHPSLWRHALRQIPTAPTATGINSNAVTVPSTSIASTAPINTDPSALPTSVSAPQIANTPPIFTASPSATSPTVSSPAASAVSNSSNPIPMSTVIGSCIGALIGAVAAILLGVWFYRRYSRSLKKRARPRGPVAHPRNTHGDESRRRSRAEPWSRLEDGDDKWEGMYQTKEVEGVAPMEKLTMFKKSPSVRTAYTHKSEEPAVFDPVAFAPYHPNLAQELASDKVTGMTVPRPFLGRVDPGNPISWDGETLGNGSLRSVLSLRSNRLEGGSMSPTLSMAIPTPPATSSEPHLWQSAEVVDLDGQSATVVSDNSQKQKKSKSNNPFFNAQDVSTKPGVRARSSSASNSTYKGKERSTDNNPFSDDNALSFPQPFAQHAPKESLELESNAADRALQNLIAALDISEDEVQERLRIASLQPSFISNTSVYTSGGEEEDVTQAFPLPPLTAGNHLYTQ